MDAGPLLPRRDFLGALALGAAVPRSAPGVVGDDLPTLAAALRAGTLDDALALAATHLHTGTTPETLLGAVLLAAVHDLRPQPIGFELHAVMMVSSAFDILRAVDLTDRATPALFNLWDYKRAQERTRAQGGFALPPAAADLPDSSPAVLDAALATHDADTADAALLALARSRDLDGTFAALWLHGARALDNIGHRAILVAQVHRALQWVGFVHAAPVLRSLARSLAREAAAPTLTAFAASEACAGDLPQGSGRADAEASLGWLPTLRDLEADAAPAAAVAAVRAGLAPAALWDGLRLRAAELATQHPGILGVHPVTTVNALHYAWTRVGAPRPRALLLLQATAWCAQFGVELARRARSPVATTPIDALAATDAGGDVRAAFDLAATDRAAAIAHAFSHLHDGAAQATFAATARTLLLHKAHEHHDYKFLAAVLEEAALAAPALRPRLLAASLAYLRHTGDPDGDAHLRGQAALADARRKR